MPIITIQNSYEFGSGLPEIARLRKGGPKTDPKRPGPDLTYFRVTMSPGFEKQLPTFQLLFGENPDYFAPVRFGGSTVDEVFDYWNRGYTATKLTHKCDGETQTRHFDMETGKYSSDPIPCESPDCGCKNTGKIKLFMPKLIEETGIFGYVLLTTTSLYDIRNLLNCFKDMEHFAAMRGADLSSIDFLIGRAPRIISVPLPKPTKQADIEKFRRNHNGQDWKPSDRMNTTKSLLYIRPTKDFTKTILLSAVNAPAQLPTSVPQVVKTTMTNKNALHPERRISGQDKNIQEPPPLVVEHDEEEEDANAPEFLDELLVWAKKTFSNIKPDHINAALEYAPNWQDSLDTAKAAIIAAAMDYDMKLISEYTASKGYEVDMYDECLEIAGRYKALTEVS